MNFGNMLWNVENLSHNSANWMQIIIKSKNIKKREIIRLTLIRFAQNVHKN